MARTPSTMVPLGTAAPDFELDDLEGTPVRLATARGPKGLLVLFLSNHCPFVKLVREELGRIGREYQARGVGVVGIMANDVEAYPDDHPDKMVLEAALAGYSFPYLFDATQEVAKAYHAACTPDSFLYDADLKLVYRGQLDDARPGNGLPVTGADLRTALDAMLAGMPPLLVQRPSLGCNIKWRPGNAPDYYGA